MNCFAEVQLLGEFAKIISVRIHIMAFPWLTRTAVPSAVMRDAPKTMGCQENHLRVPRI
jgi:hypothetical protein